MSSGKWRPFCLGLDVLKVKGRLYGYLVHRAVSHALCDTDYCVTCYLLFWTTLDITEPDCLGSYMRLNKRIFFNENILFWQS